MEEKSSTTALVLSILGLFFWLIPIIGFPIIIIGLIFSISGMKEKRKYSTAALICSIIALVLVTINAATGAYLGATGQLF